MTPSGRPASGRLGVLGGSFDPPHLGHLHVARAARRAFALDEVLFVPAARPPHKRGRVLASAAHRLALLDLLLKETSREEAQAFRVDPRELDRPGPSFTVDTLRELRAEDGRELFLILGTDNMPGLPAWREVEEVLRLAQPIIVFRAGAGDDPLAGLAASFAPESMQRLRAGLLMLEPVCVSSTELRDSTARDRADLDSASEFEGLPASLRAYIEQHGLYREAGAGGADR